MTVKTESSDSDTEDIKTCYTRDDDGIRTRDNETGEWVSGKDMFCKMMDRIRGRKAS